MTFAKACSGVNIKRIKAQGRALLGQGHALSRSMGQLIGSTHHKAIEGLAFVEVLRLIADQ